jgi:RNA polymerase sigma-70 factor (ECF subfamily)
MARRRAIDRVRSSQASRDREDRMFRREHRVAFDEVLEAVEARFERDRLTAAMGVLTPLQREAITATYLQGRTVVQATALLGASESALKTRVRDGVLGLRAVL